jgi:XrtJ-associated TM-motif-TM protein
LAGRSFARPSLTLSVPYFSPGHDKQELEDTINMKKMHLLFGFALVLLIALPLRAQTGCVDSPEDPTIVLAVLAGAGAFTAKVWRSCNRKQ